MTQAPNPFEVTPLTPLQTANLQSEIEKWREEIQEEIGEFRTEILPTGRILILADQEVPHVAYMSDEGPDARLCFDDYVPELGDPTLSQDRPSDDQ